METETGSKFQAWFASELEWTRKLRRRKVAIFWKCEGITLAVAVLVGLVGYVLDAGSSGNSDIGVIVVAAVIFSFLLVTVILVVCMVPGFLKGGYARKLRRAMKRLGFDDRQREQFAREQLAAQRDPACTASFEMAGRMPARFTLSEHYACLIGGTYYGPFIVGLDGIEAIRVSRDTSNFLSTARVFGVTISKNSTVVSHIIHFVGRGGEQGRLPLDDLPGCEKVLEILSQRFPAA